MSKNRIKLREAGRAYKFFALYIAQAYNKDIAFPSACVNNQISLFSYLLPDDPV